MSFIVKGIDLPKEPHTIKLNEKGVISVQGKDAIMIFKNAEIIEIPTPHGRLIDGDELLKRIEKSPTFASKYKETAKLFIRVYTEQGTILEAENL